MKKNVFLIFLFITTFVFADVNEKSTKDKIKETQKNLQESQDERKRVTEKITELGEQINKGKNSVNDMQKNIQELSDIVSDLEKNYQSELKRLNELNSQNELLSKSQKDLEQRIIEIISEDLSFDLIQIHNQEKSINNIMADEFVKSFNGITSQKLGGLVQKYESISAQIDETNKKIEDIKKNMGDYTAKKNELVASKAKQEEFISNLTKNKEAYIEKLEKLDDEQEEIRKVLENLKIIDDKEEREKAKAAEEKRLAKLEAQKKKEEKQSSKKDKDDDNNKKENKEEQIIDDARVAKINNKVKQYGSSYQESRVRKYSGSKTIAPLDAAYVKRKFGNYTDPVYGIKIFNESIVLGSKSSDTKVRSILPGKIVYAKDTSVLDKTIIIEHPNGIHTVYAHLSQIAPTIKVGNSVKKGYVIGRISNSLTFQVTQKNYNINPLDLIKL